MAEYGFKQPLDVLRSYTVRQLKRLSEIKEERNTRELWRYFYIMRGSVEDVSAFFDQELRD